MAAEISAHIGATSCSTACRVAREEVGAFAVADKNQSGSRNIIPLASRGTGKAEPRKVDAAEHGYAGNINKEEQISGAG